jgi:hypothetical protein
MTLIFKSSITRLRKVERRAGGVAQVTQCLPRKHEALSSNLSTEKKKKKANTCTVAL